MSIKADTLRHQVIVGTRTRGKRGSGPGEFHYPARVVTLNDRAYVCDSWNHRVQVFQLPVWTFLFEFGDFFCPKWIDVIEDRGQALLLVVDTNNCRLCLHDPNGHRVGEMNFETPSFPVEARLPDIETIEVVFEDETTERIEIPSLTRSADWMRRLEKPISIARDARGFMYVSDFGRRVVEKFDKDGMYVETVLGPDVLTLPGKMVMNGDDLLIADRPANAVFIYNTADGMYRRWEYAFEGPGYLGRDAAGNIWVGPYTCEPNPAGSAFAVFTAAYEFMRTVRFRETQQPTSIAFARNHVLISDEHARSVLTFADDGTFIGYLREQPYESKVWSVESDDQGHVYVGAGPVVDLLWVADLKRLYYIDFDNALVRFCFCRGGL